MYLKHIDSKIRLKNIPKNEIFEYSNGSELKQYIRDLPEFKTFYVIPKNAKSLKNTVNKELLFLNQFSFLILEDFLKEQSGICYLIRIAGVYAYFMKPYNRAILMDVYNWWECENEEAYSKLFSGYGCYHFDPENDEVVYNFTLLKVSYIFNKDGIPNSNKNLELKVPMYNVSYFNEHINLTFETLNNYINIMNKLYSITHNSFYPNKQITDIGDSILNRDSIPEETKLIGLHLRFVGHYLTNITTKEYYQMFLDEIMKLNLSNFKCVLFSDNYCHLNDMINILEKHNIQYINIYQTRQDELSKSMCEWINEKIDFPKYFGTILDAYMMSKCDYLIMGRSNLSLYAINLNQNLKFIIPEKIKVDTY